jgi:TPR repeat protein
MYLGEAYLAAKGVPRSDSLGLHWLEAAARHGNPQAQMRVAQLYFSGKTQKGVQYAKAIDFFARAERNPRADFELQAQATLGIHAVQKVQRRIYNLHLMLGFVDLQTAPQLRMRQ